MRTCSVFYCKNRVRFEFPTNQIIKNKWLESIRQPSLKPKKGQGLCANHFKKEDFRTKNFSYGYDLIKVYLKNDVCPSVFTWSKKKDQVHDVKNSLKESPVDNNIKCDSLSSVSSVCDFVQDIEFDGSVNNDINLLSDNNSMHSNDEERSIINNSDIRNKKRHRNYSSDTQSDLVSLNIDFQEEVIETPIVEEEIVTAKAEGEPLQEENIPCEITKTPYRIECFVNNPKAVLEFTGLESYHKFMTAFTSLGLYQNFGEVQYVSNNGFGKLSLENQFFVTLWKLRKNATDFELAVHFGIHEKQVSNICRSWILFLNKQWSRIDIWPCKELIQFYIPQSFKRDFPKTRVIIDGTELKIHRNKNPMIQQSSFSTYKNDSTLKAVVGSSPSGLFTFLSELYGGSTSDRQVMERNDLQLKCQAGDVVMADKGFAVQDIFAPHDITVTIPHFVKKGYLPPNHLRADRKFSKYRIHIERMIGLLKTYRILYTKIRHNYVHLAEEIVGICVMLCNFKENIMSNK